MPTQESYIQDMKDMYELYNSSNTTLFRESEPEPEIFVEVQAKNWYGEQYCTETWSSIAFPLVRRVFSNLLANEIVSVQPMSAPVGQLIYMDFKYEQDEYLVKERGYKYTIGADVASTQTPISTYTETIIT